MKISLLYIYKPGDRYLSNLSKFVRASKGVELIILEGIVNPTNFSKKKISGKIRHYQYPHVSDSFLFNQGIRLAKANVVGIVRGGTNIKNFSLEEICKTFSHFPKTFLLSSFQLEQIDESENMFFPKNVSLEKYISLYSGDFFLNKEIVIKEGLFFDENIDSLEILDLLIRAHRSQQLVKVIQKEKNNIPSSAKSYFEIGKGLYQILCKYRKNKYSLLNDLFFGVNDSFFGKILVSFGLTAAFARLRLFTNFRFICTRLNKMWVELCRKLRFNRLILFPTVLSIEPTNYCNAHCPLCPTGSGQLKRSKGFIDFALFKQIVDQSRFFVDQIFLWNMGEPFLHPEIFSMIQYCKRFGIYVTSSTNGYVLYSKSSVNRLIESGIDEMVVSADGIDAKTSSEYRKGVFFPRVIDGLKYLRDEKRKQHKVRPIINYQMILMSHTLSQIKKARAFAKDLDVRFLIKYLNLEMVNLANKKRFLPGDSKYELYSSHDKRPRLQRVMTNTPCVAWDGMVINWDGSVNPCLFDYYSSIVLGTVKNSPMLNIWRGNNFWNLRKQILTDKRGIDICRHCPINERFSELYYQ